MTRLELAGKRFDRLLVIDRAGINSKGHVTWNVVCDCGGRLVVIGTKLASGRKRSCGCLIRERAVKRWVEVVSARRNASDLRALEVLKSGKKNCSNADCSEVNPQLLVNFTSANYKTGLRGNCKTCSADYEQRRKYGISLKQKQSLVDAQGGLCANRKCSEIVTIGSATDHCHDTGIVRGVLCDECNMALGQLGDSPDRIHGLLDYAKAHRQLHLVRGKAS